MNSLINNLLHCKKIISISTHDFYYVKLSVQEKKLIKGSNKHEISFRHLNNNFIFWDIQIKRRKQVEDAKKFFFNFSLTIIQVHSMSIEGKKKI